MNGQGGVEDKITLEQVAEALCFLEGVYGTGFIVAVPLPMDVEDCRALATRPNVSGFVFRREQEAAVRERGVATGYFMPEAYQWTLPQTNSRRIIFFGYRSDLSFRMVREAMRTRIKKVVYMSPGMWKSEDTRHFLIVRVFEKARFVLAQYRRRALEALARPFKLLRAADPRWQCYWAWMDRVASRLPLPWLRKTENAFLAALSALSLPVLEEREFDKEGVLLVNSSLAWGGAERQIVNTLVGLHERGYGKAALLCEHLHGRPDHDFYLWQLESHGIPVSQIERKVPMMVSTDGNQEIIDNLRASLSEIPRGLADEIILFALELIKRRPGIVHAWQDSTSIKAGMAAVLVGVPRIILSSRNMAPFRFDYYLPYMASAYRALSAQGRVILLNNSNAGADDYCRWLKIPRERYRVLFNGMQSERLNRPHETETEQYRERLGIARGRKVVGSIFRLYKEKDPMLWLDTIAMVGKVRTDCDFLLVGTGVMEDEVKARAESLGLKGRLFMPGTEKNPALPLSLMDVFLLASRVEGTPNVVIEAQWLGVPVVATDAGGTADTVLTGETGWVVRSRSAKALATKVIALLDDDELRASFSRRAGAFARQRFGLEQMIDDTLDVYGFAARTASCSRLESAGVSS